MAITMARHYDRPKAGKPCVRIAKNPRMDYVVIGPELSLDSDTSEIKLALKFMDRKFSGIRIVLSGAELDRLKRAIDAAYTKEVGAVL